MLIVQFLAMFIAAETSEAIYSSSRVVLEVVEVAVALVVHIVCLETEGC